MNRILYIIKCWLGYYPNRYRIYWDDEREMNDYPQIHISKPDITFYHKENES